MSCASHCGTARMMPLPVFLWSVPHFRGVSVYVAGCPSWRLCRSWGVTCIIDECSPLALFPFQPGSECRTDTKPLWILSLYVPRSREQLLSDWLLRPLLIFFDPFIFRVHLQNTVDTIVAPLVPAMNSCCYVFLYTSPSFSPINIECAPSEHITYGQWSAHRIRTGKAESCHTGVCCL